MANAMVMPFSYATNGAVAISTRANTPQFLHNSCKHTTMLTQLVQTYHNAYTMKSPMSQKVSVSLSNACPSHDHLG